MPTYKYKGGWKKKKHSSKVKEMVAVANQLHVPRIRGKLINFPMKRRMKFFTTVNYDFSVGNGLIGGNAQDIIFRHNGIYQIGPSVNYPLDGLHRTAYSLFPQYPAGSVYMLGSDNINGANGIYSKYIVHKCKLDIEICPTTLAGAVNASPLEVVITCMEDPSLAYTDTTTQRSEYQLTHRFILPQTQTAKVFRFRKIYSVGQVFGLEQEPTTASSDYIALATGNPSNANQSSWLVRIANLNGGLTAYNGSLRATLTHWCTLFDTNTLKSTPPI